jgi:hypothetical protein
MRLGFAAGGHSAPSYRRCGRRVNTWFLLVERGGVVLSVSATGYDHPPAEASEGG